MAKNKALEVLEGCKVKREMDRDTLINVARTSLRTKVHQELADMITEVSSMEWMLCVGHFCIQPLFHHLNKEYSNLKCRCFM